MDLILLRVLFIGLIAIVCYFLQPFGISSWLGAVCGALASAAVIVFELRVRALNLRRLIGAVAGSVLGIFGASLFCMVLRSALPAGSTSAAIQVFVLLLMTYVGLLVGTSKGDNSRSNHCGRLTRTPQPKVTPVIGFCSAWRRG